MEHELDPCFRRKLARVMMAAKEDKQWNNACRITAVRCRVEWMNITGLQSGRCRVEGRSKS